MLLAGIALVSAGAHGDAVRVLVLSGQNNHAWQETTPAIQRILDDSGRFSVDVTDHPESMTAESLSVYDAVLSNWNSWGEGAAVKTWPDAARTALIEFVRGGKGFVSVHAGTSSFYEWPEYQELGIASWKLGETGHGKRHRFRVVLANRDHPITKDVLPFATTDELWHRAGVQPGAAILATAYSSAENGGSGQDEPILMARAFGSGRSVNLLPGHDATAMATPSFGILLSRSVEWAATGSVTLPARKVHWRRDDGTLALEINGEVLWQFEFGPDDSKPFFHPVAIPGGPVLSWDKPPDHVWHHGLWFCWKYINGVNFWEEDPATGRSDGITAWDSPEIATTDDGSATIRHSIRYQLSTGETLLSETRTLEIAPPGGDGNYHIDWTSVFRPDVETVTLDRTPILGEPGGQTWGGYAGLSHRFAPLSDPKIYTEHGEVAMRDVRTHVDAESLAYNGTIESIQCGIAMLQYPGNPLSPVPWYVIVNPKSEFYFFSPTLLYPAARTLKTGETLTLRYRVVVHADHWGPDALRAALRDMGAASNSKTKE